jgi:hypothetical protein
LGLFWFPLWQEALTKIFFAMIISNSQIFTDCGKEGQIHSQIVFADFSTLFLKKSFGEVKEVS